MFRRSSERRREKQDKKVYFSKENQAAKGYRGSVELNNDPKSNILIEIKNDPEHSDAIDKVKMLSKKAKAKSSIKLPEIEKAFNIEEDDKQLLGKFKRKHSIENNITYST